MGSGGNDFDMAITRAASTEPDAAGEPAQADEGRAATGDPSNGAASIDLDERPAEEAGYGYGV